MPSLDHYATSVRRARATLEELAARSSFTPDERELFEAAQWDLLGSLVNYFEASEKERTRWQEKRL